jgi:hypothetical protein
MCLYSHSLRRGNPKYVTIVLLHVHPSLRLFICLPVICLSVCLLACLSVCLYVIMSVCLPVCLSVCFTAYLLACLSVCLPFCRPACLPPFCLPPFCLPPVYLPSCLPAFLPACLPACLLPTCLFCQSLWLTVSAQKERDMISGLLAVRGRHGMSMRVRSAPNELQHRALVAGLPANPSLFKSMCAVCRPRYS